MKTVQESEDCAEDCGLCRDLNTAQRIADCAEDSEPCREVIQRPVFISDVSEMSR